MILIPRAFIAINTINKNGGPNFLQPNNPTVQKKRIFDAIAASSIISNGTGVETSKSAATWSTNDLVNFIVNRQLGSCTEGKARTLIQVYIKNVTPYAWRLHTVFVPKNWDRAIAGSCTIFETTNIKYCFKLVREISIINSTNRVFIYSTKTHCKPL